MIVICQLAFFARHLVHRSGISNSSRARHWVASLAIIASFSWVTPARANDVTPTSRVTTSVVVRAQPSTASAAIGALAPGQSLPEVASLPYWYEVRLPDGSTGYVSKSWTQEIVTESLVPNTTAPKFRIYAIDVGTGLSIFVTGRDFALLYDAGSNDDLARGPSNRVLAFLHKIRPDLTRIDHVILSHPHRDHVELLPDVINSYQIGDVWDSGRVNPICGYRLFLQAVASHASIVYHNALASGGQASAPFPQQTCYGQDYPAGPIAVHGGSQISMTPIRLGEGASMTFLHADGRDLPSPNQNSLVVRLDLGSRHLLLMGDAEAGGRADPSETPKPNSIEADLLACCRAALKADILVVGHHGSRTSSRAAFLAAVGATDFIVSSGPTRYATVTLPDAVIISELTALGHVWRTDRSDVACTHAIKIGPDNDGRAGGCENVEADIADDGREAVQYLELTD